MLALQQIAVLEPDLDGDVGRRWFLAFLEIQDARSRGLQQVGHAFRSRHLVDEVEAVD